MQIVASTGNKDISTVYIAELGQDKYVEMVESLQPPLPIEKKWVLIVSTLFGCPVKCPMCDAGGHYKGRLSKADIFDQIDFLVKSKFPDGHIDVEKFKIQFARMGEPAFNLNVIDVLEELPSRYDAPGLMPSISTIAPYGTDEFFDRLYEVKRRHYSKGRFQLQFSIHTTDPQLRDKLIPVRKWDFAKIAQYGQKFYHPGDRKIALNFAFANIMPIEPSILREHFDPEIFMIKLTPLNPTHTAIQNNLLACTQAANESSFYDIAKSLRDAGYETIVSIGEIDENLIGSNCGQYLLKHLESNEKIDKGYTYDVDAPSGIRA